MKNGTNEVEQSGKTFEQIIAEFEIEVELGFIELAKEPTFDEVYNKMVRGE